MSRQRIDDCTVSQGGTLRDALRSLDKSGVEIALVLDGQGRMVGTLTDGDVRRALLTGAGLDASLASYVHRDFISVEPSANHVEVLDLMQARSINQIPVVDSAGRLMGLHLWSDFLGGGERPNFAIVMAGGRGTRLAPLTDTVPKSMIRVAGRPILERIVLHLIGHGLKRIFLSTNYLGHIVERHFEDGAKFGAEIKYLKEDTPLGTGGPLALLPATPHPVLAMNGDLVTQANLGALMDDHGAHGAVVTVGMRRYHHTVPFGCIEMSAENDITGFEEKPTLSKWVSAGIYAISPQLLVRVPTKQEYPITALIEDCVKQREPVRGFEIEDDWIDVGQRDHLRQARGGE